MQEKKLLTKIVEFFKKKPEANASEGAEDLDEVWKKVLQ
jgi:hypothetical protein